MEFWQLTQNLGKGLRTNLGGSPRRLRHLCQFYFPGNTLTDPATGRPVLVAEADSLEELLPPGLRPGPAELRDPAGVLERLEDGPWRLRFRLLPYRAVGVERGLLLALRMDRVQVGEEDRGPMLAALSPTPVSDGGAYRVLVGAE